MDCELVNTDLAVDDDESVCIYMAVICRLLLNWLSGRTDTQIRLPMGDRNVLREMFLKPLLCVA